jgi:ubiquinone/menaquinone biosynthesis C-methylase UbiE
MVFQGRNRLIVAIAVGSALLTVGTGLGAQQGNRSTRESEREKQQRVTDIFKAMGADPGAVVADIGAGSGFFTVRLAGAVGDTGRVLAVDIKSSVVQALRKRAADEGFKNVEVIEGEVANPHLPEQSLDAALIVNAYHEMTEHQSMLAHIRRALKPSGRLVIVEPISPSRRDASRDTQTRQHEIGPEFVMKDAREAGFAVVGLEDPFSNQHGHGSEYMLVLTPVESAK